MLLLLALRNCISSRILPELELSPAFATSAICLLISCSSLRAFLNSDELSLFSDDSCSLLRAATLSSVCFCASLTVSDKALISDFLFLISSSIRSSFLSVAVFSVAVVSSSSL
ncbi:hypothetical protein HanPSC8_Chr16g0715721 [Helianthus annuus]|nr:hypothetical protein HanPSC8_Chr16g0715721 [Helianthus annuus]